MTFKVCVISKRRLVKESLTLLRFPKKSPKRVPGVKENNNMGPGSEFNINSQFTPKVLMGSVMTPRPRLGL